MGLGSLFQRRIAVPQDHGSWVFLLSPLLIGLAAGERLTPASGYLALAALGAFLARQPLSILVKTWSGRRPARERPAAVFWVAVDCALVLGGLAGLVASGFAPILVLSVPAALVFAWHLWLVGRRRERRQAGVEIVAAGVLALAAPAAYWVGMGVYSHTGWLLWLLTWLQSAASIVYAYLRLEQRELRASTATSELWKMGSRALAYTSFNLALSVLLGWHPEFSRWLFVPFLVQWLETLWGIANPAAGWKPTRIGLRQLVVSTIFTLTFVVIWRLA